MKIKAEIRQDALSVSATITETRPFVIKLEYRTLGSSVQEYTPLPSDSGLIDSLLTQGRFDNQWLKRVLQESITTCENITDYLNCRDISSFFIPTLQDKVIPNMSNRFRGNPCLIALPTLDWSGVEDVGAICFNNKGMVEIDMPGSQNVKVWRQAFYGCNSVQRIHRLDLSGAIMLSDIFYGCSSLQTLPFLDTRNATNFANFVNGCISLERIDGVDFSSSQSEINIGQNQYSKLNSLTELNINGTISQNIVIYADNLSENSLRRLVDALVSLPQNLRTMTVTKILYSKIDKGIWQIATDKKWQIVSL